MEAALRIWQQRVAERPEPEPAPVNEASIHTSMLLVGSTTELGALRTQDVAQARQAKVINATRRLLQSESMVNMLQEAGVELPTLEELSLGRRRAMTAHGRGDWRSALNKGHGNPQTAPSAADAGGSGDAASGAAADDAAAAAAAAAPEADASGPQVKSPRKKPERGGWRKVIARDGEDIERNPVVRRLKKLRHKVLYGKVGEKAYARYRATLRANLTWRDILRPNLSTAKRQGHNQPGFSRWLDGAITEEQKREVRIQAARAIQRAWREFKRFRIESVMQHVRNYEMGNYEWSDDSSVATDDLSDLESSDDGADDGKKKTAKKKRGKSAKSKDPSYLQKRAILAAVAGAMDEETMGDAVVAGAPKRLARRRRKKKKAHADGDGSDEGDGADDDGAGGEAGEGEEGGEDGSMTARGRKKGRKGRKGGGTEGGEEGEEGTEDGEEDGAASGKRGKSARRKKGGKSRPASPPDEGAELNLPDIGAFLATMEANEARRTSRLVLQSHLTPQAPSPEPQPPQPAEPAAAPPSPALASDTPESTKGKKGKKGKKGEKAETVTSVDIAAFLAEHAPGGAAEAPPQPAAEVGAGRAQGGRSMDGRSPSPPPPAAEEPPLDHPAAPSAHSTAPSTISGAAGHPPETTTRDCLIDDTPRSAISAVDPTEGDLGQGWSTDGGTDGALTARSTEGGSGKTPRRRRKRRGSKRPSEAPGLNRISETGPPPAPAGGRFAARLTSDNPDWSKTAHSAALFDASTDVAKRAEILARMAREGGPGWRPTGAIAEWLNMSEELYQGEDPEKRAAAMAKVAAAVAAAGHPLWRPGGDAVREAFSASRTLYDGDDPHKRAEAMVKVTAQSGHPIWRPGGFGPGFGGAGYDTGPYEGTAPLSQRTRWDYREAPPWKPPGVPRIDYYNYYRRSEMASSSSSSESSADQAKEGETPEERAQRRAEKRAERRALREQRRGARTSGVAAEGSAGSLGTRVNARKPWRFAYVVDGEPPPPGNDPPAARFEHVTRDDKGGPKPWKYTVIPEHDHNVPYNIWGPYVDARDYRSPRLRPLQGSKDGDPEAEVTPRSGRMRPLSARIAGPDRASSSAMGTDGSTRASDAASTGSGGHADAPHSPATRPGRGGLRRSYSMAALETQMPRLLRRAMSARSRIVVPPAPPGGIPSHIVLSPEAAAKLAAEVSAMSAASGRSSHSTVALVAPRVVHALPAPLSPTVIPAQASSSSLGLMRGLSLKGRSALPPTARVNVPPAGAAGDAATAATTTAAAAAAAAEERRDEEERDEEGADDAGGAEPGDGPHSHGLSRAVSFAASTESSHGRLTSPEPGPPHEPSHGPLTDTEPGHGPDADSSAEIDLGAGLAGAPQPGADALAPAAGPTEGSADGDAMPDLSGPLAMLAGAIAMGAGVLLSAAAPPPPVLPGEAGSELEKERSATHVAAAAAAVEAAVEAVAAVLSTETSTAVLSGESSAGPPGPPPLLPPETREPSVTPPRPPPQKEPSAVSQGLSSTSTGQGDHLQTRLSPRPAGASEPEDPAAPPPPAGEPSEDVPPAWLYTMPSHASVDPRTLYGSPSRRGLRGRRRTVDDEYEVSEVGGGGRGTLGRRDRDRTQLHPPALSDAADGSPRLKRICSARGVGAFTSAGIQPYPLDPELLRCVPPRLLQSRGQSRARSAPGSPRTFLTGEVSVATAATVATATSSISGRPADPEPTDSGATVQSQSQAPYSYVYGYGPPGTAATIPASRAEPLSRNDLPPLPAILQDPRAQEFLAFRGNKMLAHRRLAAKGAAQPDPRSMYELLFLGRRVDQYRKQQYVAGTLAPGHGTGGATGGGIGIGSSSAASPQRRARTMTGLGPATAAAASGGGGTAGLAALADAHVKAQAQLSPGQTAAQLFSALPGEASTPPPPAVAAAWGRPARGASGQAPAEPQVWAAEPAGSSPRGAAHTAGRAAGAPAAWNAGPQAQAAAGPQQWATVPQPPHSVQPLSGHHTLPPVRPAGALQHPLPGSMSGSIQAALALAAPPHQPRHSFNAPFVHGPGPTHPAAAEQLRRSAPPTPLPAGTLGSPLVSAPPPPPPLPLSGSGGRHGSGSYTQYTFSVPPRPDSKGAAAAAADGLQPARGLSRPGSGRSLAPGPGGSMDSQAGVAPVSGSAQPQQGGSDLDAGRGASVSAALQPSLGRSSGLRPGGRASGRNSSREGSSGSAGGGEAGVGVEEHMLDADRGAGAPVLPPISQQQQQQQQGQQGAPPQQQSSQTKPPSPQGNPVPEGYDASPAADAASPRLPAVGQRRDGRPPPPPAAADAGDRADAVSPRRRRLRGQLRMGRAPLGAPLVSRMPERPPGAATS